jgi:Cys-rich repeat protein
MRITVIGGLLLALCVVRPALAGPSEDSACDRTGDHKVTTIDALMALHDAVGDCRTSEECDVDGDEERTATDALLLLRYAVSLPVELACGCLYIDQCIGSADDADCAENGFPGYHCFGSICVQCIDDADCEEGNVCDLCSRSCVPASQ